MKIVLLFVLLIVSQSLAIPLTTLKHLNHHLRIVHENGGIEQYNYGRSNRRNTHTLLNNVALDGGAISVYNKAGVMNQLQLSGRLLPNNCTGNGDGAFLALYSCMLLPFEVLIGLLMLPTTNATYPRPLDYPTVGAQIVNNGSVFYTSDEGQALAQLTLLVGGLLPTTTFAQLQQQRGTYLNVVTYCEEYLQVFMFNPDTTPDVLVADAVAASLAGTYIYNHVWIVVPASQGVPAGNYSFTTGYEFNYPLSVYADSLSNTVGVNSVFTYQRRGTAVFDDTAEANEIIRQTYAYMNRVTGNQINTVRNSHHTCNTYMLSYVYPYSHFLNETTHALMISDGEVDACNYLRSRYGLLACLVPL